MQNLDMKSLISKNTFEFFMYFYFYFLREQNHVSKWKRYKKQFL